MDLEAIRQLAHTLMRQHRVWPEYRFSFGLSTRRVGLCISSSRHKEIQFSRMFAGVNDEKFIRNVLLHEIAHALRYKELGGKRGGHDAGWKAIAKRIGCDGERCVEIPHKKS